MGLIACFNRITYRGFKFEVQPLIVAYCNAFHTKSSRIPGPAGIKYTVFGYRVRHNDSEEGPFHSKGYARDLVQATATGLACFIVCFLMQPLVGQRIKR